MFRLAVFVLIIGIVHQANGNTCTWTWTTPASSTTAQSVSIGAPVTFVAMVSGTTLKVDDKITLKVAGTAAHDVTYANGDTWTEGTNTYTSVFTSTAGSAADTRSYSFAIPEGKLAAAQTGAVTIENDDCTTGSTLASSVITLTVKSCDLNAYGNLATAANQDACDYNCEKEFTCATDSTKKFTAKCQADATWSVPYACDVCTSAGVKEVALLALVMLSSALSTTHLM